MACTSGVQREGRTTLEPAIASGVPSATSSVPSATSPASAEPAPSPSSSAAAGTKLGHRPASSPVAEGVVPILYYHRSEAPPTGYSSWPAQRQQAFLTYDVIPSALAAQLDRLAAEGYTTILPRDLAAHWDSGARLPARPVILTFDDGFHDWVTTILPLLQAHHMVGEFYLTLSAIATGTISWADVRALAAAGNGIGAHDVHHVQLAMLGANRPPAAPATMWREVHDIRSVIKDHVGVAPDSMAYVGGGYDATLLTLVEKAGYTTARSIVRGIEQTQAERYLLRVVRIGGRDDVVDPVTGELVPGLPTFVARMNGVTGKVR